MKRSRGQQRNDRGTKTAKQAGTVVTDDFTGLAANYANESLRPLWDTWLYSTDVP